MYSDMKKEFDSIDDLSILLDFYNKFYGSIFLNCHKFCLVI